MTRQQNNFGTYVKKRRVELKKTQDQVAKEVGVSQNFVTYLEKNQRKPSREILKKLSLVLGLPLSKLYFEAYPDIKKIVGFNEKENIFLGRMSPILENLKTDRGTRKKYDITDTEIEQLASLRLKGEVKTKEDYVFLLMTIRQVVR